MRSWAERLYLSAHRLYFAHRLKKQSRFKDKYVISVGNLSAGGVGKTPVTALLLRHLLQCNIKPLSILRGYKAQLSSKGALVYDGREVFYNVRQVGDEALLLAGLPGVRVAIGKDRAQAIRLHGQGLRAVVLDDAFQNPSVYRDHDLVLLDATTPLSNMRLFPYGRMREPLTALSRAHTLLITRCDQAYPEELQALRTELLKYVPEEAVFCARHKVFGLETLKPSDMPLISKLPHSLEPVGAFCGIGNPQVFFDSLKGLGYDLKQQRTFPDHHWYSVKELKKLITSGPRVWVTTAKDRVRIQSQVWERILQSIPLSARPQIFVLKVGIEVIEGRLADFLKRVLGPLWNQNSD